MKYYYTYAWRRLNTIDWHYEEGVSDKHPIDELLKLRDQYKELLSLGVAPTELTYRLIFWSEIKPSDVEAKDWERRIY